ncbi:helix-turn-helix transcriptional regulator [Curtobacterium sp. Csp1]|uniref:PadR family transcriptional regulator n=1 Tax=unclassified Curtobacterium TaxID=257496 RepID=UPI001580829A|nr:MULTISPECIES: helix-turn-helix transcriptional regulator [unclassified Curtobacterium]QKS17659.1 helix-turn-helix transcriptional regulator [Curtobacterium sp. Csp2]QKS20171.1 helix-turn-helix transcriptional regulator [Curtobacterium sp. Csp1]
MSTPELREPAFWVLTTLARGRAHGYGIIQSVAELSAGNVALAVTTLYKTLERLESDGLVEGAGDEVIGGRLRRYYALTSAGTRRLEDETDRLALKVRALEAGLRRPSVAPGRAFGA